MKKDQRASTEAAKAVMRRSPDFQIPVIYNGFGFFFCGNGDSHVNEAGAIFYDLTLHFKLMVCLEIIVGFDSHFFFQIVLFFFQKIINFGTDFG